MQSVKAIPARERQMRIERCAFDALSEHYVLNPIPKSESQQARNLLLMRSTCRAIASGRH